MLIVITKILLHFVAQAQFVPTSPVNFRAAPRSPFSIPHFLPDSREDKPSEVRKERESGLHARGLTRVYADAQFQRLLEDKQAMEKIRKVRQERIDAQKKEKEGKRRIDSLRKSAQYIAEADPHSPRLPLIDSQIDRLVPPRKEKPPPMKVPEPTRERSLGAIAKINEEAKLAQLEVAEFRKKKRISKEAEQKRISLELNIAGMEPNILPDSLKVRPDMSQKEQEWKKIVKKVYDRKSYKFSSQVPPEEQDWIAPPEARIRINVEKEIEDGLDVDLEERTKELLTIYEKTAKDREEIYEYEKNLMEEEDEMKRQVSIFERLRRAAGANQSLPSPLKFRYKYPSPLDSPEAFTELIDEVKNEEKMLRQNLNMAKYKMEVEARQRDLDLAIEVARQLRQQADSKNFQNIEAKLSKLISVVEEAMANSTTLPTHLQVDVNHHVHQTMSHLQMTRPELLAQTSLINIFFTMLIWFFMGSGLTFAVFCLRCSASPTGNQPLVAT